MAKRYGENVDNLISKASNKSNTLLIMGIVFISFSSVFFLFACYQRRKAYSYKLTTTDERLLNLGKNLNSVAFNRYSDLNLNSDEENPKDSSKYISKNKKVKSQNKTEHKSSNHQYSKLDSGDKKKLLLEENDEEDEESVDIFIR